MVFVCAACVKTFLSVFFLFRGRRLELLVFPFNLKWHGPLFFFLFFFVYSSSDSLSYLVIILKLLFQASPAPEKTILKSILLAHQVPTECMLPNNFLDLIRAHPNFVHSNVVGNVPLNYFLGKPTCTMHLISDFLLLWNCFFT